MEEEKYNRYIIGILGSLIGAIIGAIPWILLYIYANLMSAIFAIFIVLGSYYGYKITKAKIDKKLPVIVSITSFISITITMFLIIPICLMVNENIPVNMESFRFIYKINEFTSAILTDYLISVLFCALIISGIVVNLNKQIKEGIDSKNIKLISQNASNQYFSKEDIEKVGETFDKKGAIDKNNPITKEEILEDLEKELGEEKSKNIFNYLKIQQIIKKKSGKFYFSNKAQNNIFYRYGISSIKTFFIVMIIAVTIACIILFTENQTNNENLNLLTDNNRLENNIYEIGTDNLKLDFPDDMVILSKDEVVYYFGQEYANMYKCIAVSSDFEKIIMVVIDEKANYDKEYTSEEYLKLALNNDKIEIKNQKVLDYNFYTVEQEYKNDEKTYLVTDYLYNATDKYIVIIIDNLKNNKIDLKDILLQ